MLGCLLSSFFSTLQVHLPCEDHIQVPHDQRCQGPACLVPSQARHVQKVPSHQALEEETLGLEVHPQREGHHQNRLPDSGWVLSMAHDLWALEVLAQCRVLDKHQGLDLAQVTFQRVR